MLITEVLKPRGNWQTITEATDKNLHLEHLEDLILNDGYQGAVTALKYVNALRMMLNVGGEGQSKVTVKWDGAPAIFCGTDPVDGKFFVGTKAVFGKTEKHPSNIVDEILKSSSIKSGLISFLKT